MFAQSLTQGSGLFELGGKRGAGSDLATDHNRMSRIELGFRALTTAVPNVGVGTLQRAASGPWR